MVASRFDVLLVALDPTVGSEIRKTRPCCVVSPDQMNAHLRTLLVAPMTSKGRVYPTRVPCSFEGKSGLVVLDQLRTIDSARVIRRLGRLAPAEGRAVLSVLASMFAP